MPVRLAGCPWFSEAEYQEVRAMMADGARLPENYDAWLRGAETAERDLREQGLHPVRVAVVPADFLEWCEKRQQKPDAMSRRTYAGSVLTEDNDPA